MIPLIVGGATAAAFALIAWQLVRRRQAYRASVVATVHGVDIIPGPCRARWYPHVHTHLAEHTLGAAIDFWVSRYPAQAARIRAEFQGAKLVLHDELIRQPETGYMARGLTDGRTMNVAWRPEDPMVQMLSLIRHEAGHLAMYAAGVKTEHHHETMRREEYGA